MYDSQRLDAHLQKLIEEGCFPSVSLCIYHKGQPVYSKAFGLADPELNHRATTATRYDLASLSKIFSMTVFFRMVDQGLFSLDEPLSKYMPEFSGPRDIRESANYTTPVDDPVLGTCDAGSVTFRQLLAHCSGLGGGHMYIRAQADDGQPIHQILKMPFRYAPGTSLVYSDQDIMLIAAALERVTGRPLDDLVEEYVLRPLQLESSGYARISRGGLHGDVAATMLCPWRGCRIRGVVQNEDCYLMDGVAGHTGIFSTAEDVARLVQNYLSAVQGTPGLLSTDLARETIRLQASFEENRRGLLWQLRTPDVADATFPTSLVSFGHTGWTGTMTWADVERDMVFALLTNDIYLPQEKRTLFARRKSIVEYILEMIDRA